MKLKDREKDRKQSEKLIWIKIKKKSVLCEADAFYTLQGIF